MTAQDEFSDKYAEHVFSNLSNSISELVRESKFKTWVIASCIVVMVALGVIVFWQAHALSNINNVADCRAKAFGQTFDDTVIGLTSDDPAERQAAFERINSRPTLVEQYEACDN